MLIAANYARNILLGMQLISEQYEDLPDNKVSHYNKKLYEY